MHLSAILITILAFIFSTTALPIGISFSEDLKTAIALKRAQERSLASSDSLSEEKRAYNLETVEIATFRYKRDLDTAVLNSRSERGKPMLGRSGRSASRTDPDH